MSRIQFAAGILLPTVLCAGTLELREGPADVLVFKDEKGAVCAQAATLRVAKHLKVQVGDIIATTGNGLSEAEVISKAVHALKGVPGGYQKWIKASGTILIKSGIYDLGEKGLEIPFIAHLVIEGEGWDTNSPDAWRSVGPSACPATYLLYRGKGKAVRHAEKWCPATAIEFRNLTIVLCSGADCGLFVPAHMSVVVDGVAVLALKKAKTAVYVNSVAGNVCYFKNIFVHGPFEVGFSEEVDWGCLLNIHLSGPIKKPLISRKPVFGLLIDGPRSVLPPAPPKRRKLGLEKVGSLPLGRVHAVEATAERIFFSSGGFVTAHKATARRVEKDPLWKVATGGAVLDLKAFGRYLFVADSLAGLKVLSCENGRVLASIETEDRTYRIALTGNILFAACGREGLVTFDISEPERVRRIATFKTDGEALSVRVAEWKGKQVACISFGWKGVALADVTQPASMRSIISVDTPDYALDAALKDNHLFVADDEALQVYRLTARNARKVAEFLPRQSSPCWYRDVCCLLIKGKTLFLCSALYPAGGKGGLTILDISRPENPKVLWEDSTTWAADVELRGKDLLVAYGTRGWSLLRGEGKSWSKVYGFGAAPVFGLARRIHLFGHCAYLAAPPQTGYIAGGHSGYIVDISKPGMPKFLKAAPYGCIGFYMVKRGKLCYVLGSRLFVADLSDPANPLLLGSTSPCGTGTGITGRYAFAGVVRGGLNVLDISDPKKPKHVANVRDPYPAFGYLTDTLVMKGLLFVRAYGNGIAALDIHEPTKPKLVGLLEQGGGGYALYGVPERDLVVYINAGGKIVTCDVSEPRDPRIISVIPAYARGLDISQSLLFVADAGVGLRVFDFSEPQNPSEIARHPCDEAWDVKVNLPYVYVADGDLGLQVFRLTEQPGEWKAANIPQSRGIHYGPFWKGGPMWYFSALGQRPYRTLTVESELVRINDPLLVLGMCDLRIDEDYVPVVAEGSRVVLCGASYAKGEEGSALEFGDGRVFRLGSDEAP